MDLASSSDIVKCPVCQTVPRDKIFLCENDHSICEGCYDDLPFRVQETTIGRASSVVRWQDWGREDQLVKVCPKGKCCYSDPPKRSFKEEEAVEAATDLTFSCKYREYGCKKSGRKLDIEKHESFDCTYYPHMVQCPIKGCFQKFDVLAGAGHFLQTHSSRMLKDVDSFTIPWDLSKQEDFMEESIVLKSRSNTFLLQRTSYKSMMGLVVWNLGTKEEAEVSSVTFKMETLKSRLKPALSYEGPVWSTQDFTLDQIVREKRSFNVNRELLANYLDPGTENDIVTFQFSLISQ